MDNIPGDWRVLDKPDMYQKLMLFISTVQKYPKMDNKAIASHLKRTVQAVTGYRRKLDALKLSVVDGLTETLPPLDLDNREPHKNFSIVLSNTNADENPSDGESIPEEPGQAVGRNDPVNKRSLIWAYRLCVKTQKHLSF